jgi:hypothetical protein
MTSEQVAALARECVTLVKSRAVDAVRYCEAYEGTDQCIVFDGSAYGPSMRVLPRADEVWEASFDQDDADLWQTFVDITDEVEGFEIPDGRTDSDDPDSWVLSWEDGILWAYAPEHGERES